MNVLSLRLNGCARLDNGMWEKHAVFEQGKAFRKETIVRDAMGKLLYVKRGPNANRIRNRNQLTK